ncbi:MAG: hypothetical protein PHD48_10850 [Alphaproteobacteria bacterium]|nr:hypothetical protein [Alphaproteobacteria bacterium]
MTSPSPQETLAELNELSQFFITAEATIKKGQEVDMSGIDDRVTTLCLTVQTAIPEQQKLYLPELNILLNLLNSCELAIRVMQSTQESSPQQTE